MRHRFGIRWVNDDRIFRLWWSFNLSKCFPIVFVSWKQGQSFLRKHWKSCLNASKLPGIFRQTWGQKQFWVLLTFTMNINDCPLPCKHTSAFTLLPEQCSRQQDHPRHALVFMSIWVCCSRSKSTLKAMWRVKIGSCADLSQVSNAQGYLGLSLFATSPSAMGKCRLTRLTPYMRSSQAI